MAANEKSVDARIFLKSSPRLVRKSFHVLAIFDDRQPFTMFVRDDAVESLQHFIPFDEETAATNMVVGKDCAPYRMSVKHGTRRQFPDNRQMKQRFRRRFTLAASAQNMSMLVDFENL